MAKASRSPETILERLLAAPPASFHVLDPDKAVRMGAKTMYIPSPYEVAEVINAVPFGQTRTIKQVRAALAVMGKAETACPFITIRYWKWLANAGEEAVSVEPRFAIPWWRVLKDGKPSSHMPGGVAAQLALLQAERA